MKTTISLLFAISVAPFVLAQSPSPSGSAAASSSSASSSTASSPKRTDLYHVHFATAAPGKAQALGEQLKTPGGPTTPVAGHLIVLRHQDGDSWDYCAIEHLGPKATLEATHPTTPPGQMAIYAMHTDTFATGPSWSEFAKALGLDESGKSDNKGSAYIVSTYRAGIGQRDALDQFLNQPQDKATDSSVGQVLLQHIEGAAWNFVSIQRWNSWADYGKDQVNSIAQMGRNQRGGWFKLRELISFHTDTLCDRIAP